jgi:hypothetical protein
VLSNGVLIVPGAVGHAFSFDGVDDWVMVPSSPSLNMGPGQDFSIEGWIKPEVAATSFGVQSILDKRISPNFVTATGYSLHLEYGHLGCQIGAAGTGYVTHNTTSPNLRDGLWHHIALTLVRNSSAGGKLYVDGKVVAVFNPTSQQGDLSTTAPLRIGDHADRSLNCHFKGLIDEFSVYRRALTETEIAGIHAAGTAGKCTRPVCAALPEGAVSWWAAEQNAQDKLGANHGTPQGTVGFTTGKVAQAFDFTGAGYVKVPASASLNVGVGPGLTIETWIKPNDLVSQQPLVEWNNGAGFMGTHLWLSVPYGIGGQGSLWANLVDVNNTHHQVTSTTNLLNTSEFQHVALTYDKTSGTAALYLNGLAVANTNLGVFTPYTASDLYLGARVSGVLTASYNGAMDEVAIYSRALSAAEIAAIHTAGSAGRCLTGTAPEIVTQPVSRSVVAGLPTTFTVVATGTPPLLYQWKFNGDAIAGATDSEYAIPNVQLSDAGIYSVVVANALGWVASSNATLTVNQAPVAICQEVVVPAGSNCLAMASIDNGSYDPDGDPITIQQIPPGPYSPGTTVVSLVVADSQGNSNACASLVTVLDTLPPTIVCPPDLVITNAHAAWMAQVEFTVTAADNCSGLTVASDPPSGAYFSVGTTTVQCRAVDAGGNVAACSFTVTVLPGNHAPTPVIEVAPLATFAGWTNLIVIAPDNTNALVRFDGSKSYDGDDTNFLYFWFEGTNLLATTPVTTNVLAVGTHEVVLWLDDTLPYGTNCASVTVEVITPAQAVTILFAMLENSNLSARSRRPLEATLGAALAAFESGRFVPAANQLTAFQNKVRAQVTPFDPALAGQLLAAAQSIIDALAGTMPPSQARAVTALSPQ